MVLSLPELPHCRPTRPLTARRHSQDAALSSRLKAFREQGRQRPAYKKMAAVRAKLPAAKKAASLLELLASAQVISRWLAAAVLEAAANRRDGSGLQLQCHRSV